MKQLLDSMMKPLRFDSAKILTIGDAMLDRYWHGETTRISAEAPIPVMDVKEIEDRLGGAANVALNISTLGAKSYLVAAVGKDSMARELRAKLEASSVEAELIEQPDKSTTTKIRLVSRNQQLVRADFEEYSGISSETLGNAISKFDEADSVILSDYDKGLLEDPQPLIRKYVAEKKPILVDPKHKEFSIYRGATIIKPNLSELEHAVGGWVSESELLKKVRILLNKMSWSAMLITRASEGMTLIEPGDESHFPAKARSVYDTSGAGDTVISVLAASLSSGYTLKDSVAFSNVAAGIVVSHFGVASVSGPELSAEVSSGDSYIKGVMSAEQLVTAVRYSKSLGERIVFTNGCFDILHAGHVDYLEEAKKEGDVLIVGINADESVARMKGEGRPINTAERRMKILSSLEAVDWVVSFEEDTPESIIEMISPDVLVKGGDYSVDQIVGADLVRAYGGKVKVLSFVEDCSTSAMVEKIRKL